MSRSEELKSDGFDFLDTHSHDTFEAQQSQSDAATEGAARLGLVLNLALQAFQQGKPPRETVDRLAKRLHQLRRELPASQWKRLVPVAQEHRVADYLLQDPFTRWSFEKPRGYAGDAGLLDIYYKHHSADDLLAEATPLGQEIYAYTSDVPSAVAGRERRDILTRTVDQIAADTEQAEVLSIACGHMREAENSDALSSGKLKRWIGLDQDPVSVGIVKRDQAGTAVDAIDGTVRGILRRAYKLGEFDLVYASGLYDYLPRPIAIRLLQRAVELVRPGGLFLFANFSDEITSDGYMETFMDWPLILRSADDMWDIVNSSVDRNEFEAEVYYGSNRNIVYGQVRKKAR